MYGCYSLYMKVRTILIFTLLVSLFVLFLMYLGVGVLRPKYDLEISGNEFRVDIARTQHDRARGLSGLRHFGEKEGLLFVFEQAGTHGIWMHEMRLPIDILWFDSRRVLIDYIDNVDPDTYPEVYRPTDDALYVLEINSGIREKYGIMIGDKFTLQE
jgi:uncharacterized membrane protein (UPF0127 family)